MWPPTGFLLWLGSSKVVTLTPPLHQKIYVFTNHILNAPTISWFWRKVASAKPLVFAPRPYLRMSELSILTGPVHGIIHTTLYTLYVCCPLSKSHETSRKCLFVCVSVCTPSRSLRCLCHRSDQRSGHSYKTVTILVLNIRTVWLQLLFCYDVESHKSCVKRNFSLCKPSEPDISVKRLPLGACGGPILKSGETPWCWIVRLAHNVRSNDGRILPIGTYKRMYFGESYLAIWWMLQQEVLHVHATKAYQDK